MTPEMTAEQNRKMVDLVKIMRLAQTLGLKLFTLAALALFGLNGLPTLYAATNNPAPDSTGNNAALSIQLQVAVRQHVEHHRISGFWHYIDHDQRRPARLKPDYSNPTVFRIGDYFALKYLFLDVKGQPRPMVFYLTLRRPSEYIVIHVDAADGAALERLVRDKVAVPVDIEFAPSRR
jgi:hypothetical protein